jgi:hypothetical protein
VRPLSDHIKPILSPKNDDETLPIINESKHPKKEGEYKEYKARTHPRRQKNHQMRANHQGTLKFSNPLFS